MKSSSIYSDIRDYKQLLRDLSETEAYLGSSEDYMNEAKYTVNASYTVDYSSPYEEEFNHIISKINSIRAKLNGPVRSSIYRSIERLESEYDEAVEREKNDKDIY